jgi:hypothetical protein
VKEQNLLMQKIIQYLHQNDRYARFLLAISRFKHDIDANYVGFCSKILDMVVSTSHSRHFDAEKWFFSAKATSVVDLRVSVVDLRVSVVDFRVKEKTFIMIYALSPLRDGG